MVSTKEKILDAAELLFAEQGIDRASLRAITGKAGANLGSIHYYFGNKKNLVNELLSDRTKEFSRQRTAEFEAFIKSGKRDLKELWLILAKGVIKIGDTNPHLLVVISRLLWAPDPEYRAILEAQEVDFDEAFVREVLTYFPEEYLEEAEIRCRMILSMILISSVEVSKSRLTLDKFRINLGLDRLAEEMADIAFYSLKKFLPDTT